MPKVMPYGDTLHKQKIFKCNDRHLDLIENLMLVSDAVNFTDLMHKLLELGYAYYTGEVSLEVDTVEEAQLLYLKKIEELRRRVIASTDKLSNPSVSTTQRRNCVSELKDYEQGYSMLNKMMNLEMEARGVLKTKDKVEANLKREKLEHDKVQADINNQFKLIDIKEKK